MGGVCRRCKCKNGEILGWEPTDDGRYLHSTLGHVLIGSGR